MDDRQKLMEEIRKVLEELGTERLRLLLITAIEWANK